MNFSGKNIYIVSDLHMGDGSVTDNFHKERERFISFLDYFESLSNSVLILNGDIFEFWQASMPNIFYNNYDILERLMKPNIIFIVGNHDYELLYLAKLPLHNAINIVDRIELIDRGKKRIKIIHGHQFDPFNQPGKSAFIGKIMALLFAHLESQYPNLNVENWAQKIIEPIMRKVVLSISSAYKKIFINNLTSNGRLDLELETYHKANPYDILVTGHTHRAGWWNDYYVNSGAWQEQDSSCYIKIDTTGRIQLLMWPEQKEITQQVDLYGYISKTAVRNLYKNRNRLKNVK